MWAPAFSASGAGPRSGYRPSRPTPTTWGFRGTRRRPGCFLPSMNSVDFSPRAPLVRPDKSVAEVRVKSVKKKLKDKAFARGVNRGDVRNGAEELGVELGEHIEFVRDAMATIANELELPPEG